MTDSRFMNTPLLPVAVLSLDREEKTNPAPMEALLRRAAERGARLAVLPFGFPAEEPAAARQRFAVGLSMRRAAAFESTVASAPAQSPRRVRSSSTAWPAHAAGARALARIAYCSAAP